MNSVGPQRSPSGSWPYRRPQERVSAAEIFAAEIVAKNVAARGGLDAWRKVETMVWIGHIESAHAPLPRMQFKLEQKRPNKTRLQMNALGDKSVRAFDGVQGWKLRTARGRPEVQPYTPQELKFAQAAHGIDGPLIDYAAKGNSVTLESLDEIGGRKAYHLNVRLPRGGNEDVWVDTKTYLSHASSPAGNSLIATTVEVDYEPLTVVVDPITAVAASVVIGKPVIPTCSRTI